MKQNKKSKEGYVLLLTLSFLSIISMGIAFMLNTSNDRVFTAKRESNHLKARLVSETALRNAFVKISKDPSIRTLDDFSNSRGAASLETKEIGNGRAVLVTAKSKVNGTEAETSVIIGVPGSDGSPTSNTENNASAWFDSSFIFAGKISVSNGGKLIYHKMNAYSASTFYATGGSNNDKSLENNPGIIEAYISALIENNSQVKPDIYTPVLTIKDSAKHNGDYIQTEVPLKTMSLDLDPFQKIAESLNTVNGVYNNVKSLTDSYISANELNDGALGIWDKADISPAGGILWVEGDLTIGAEATITATAIIATGNITIQGNAKQNGNSNLLLASKQGDVKITGGQSVSVTCLLYADQGNVTIDNDASLDGRVICPNGTFSLAGGATLKADTKNDLYEDHFVLKTKTDEEETDSEESVKPWIVAWVK